MCRLCVSILALTCLVVLACGDDHESTPIRRPAESESSASQWFVEITDRVGLDFTHETGASGDLYAPEIMGAGAALVDVDGDRDLDIYLINGAPDLGRDPARGDTVNRLYVQGADGRFTDATAGSGLDDPGYGMGVAAGDIDNDGDTDLYVANFGADSLYRNRGDGTYERIELESDAVMGGWSTSAAFCDLDRDGWLDLYVARYVVFDPEVDCYDVTGRREFCGPDSFPDATDVLLHNDGRGRFSDITSSAGIDAVTGAGLGVVCHDLSGDGWPDIYVANDADPNQLWINQRDGTFRDEAVIRGASVNAQGKTEAGMGVVAADFDRDLDLDLFMTHLRDEHNTFYLNLGNELGFEDRTARTGLASSSMPYTGFGTAAFDADHDSDLDLVVVNGRVKRGDLIPNQLEQPWAQYAEPNLFYLNRGDATFELVQNQVMAFASRIEVSRGLATGDLDDDGDLDLLVSNAAGPVRIYRNEMPKRGHWLMVEPFDRELNRVALGATVTAMVRDDLLLRTATAASSYLSSSEPVAHFGLGEAERVESLIVTWPDGEREEFGAVAADQRIRLVRTEGETLP